MLSVIQHIFAFQSLKEFFESTKQKQLMVAKKKKSLSFSIKIFPT